MPINVNEIQSVVFLFSMQLTLDGKRNQIFLNLPTAAELRDNLNSFSEFYSQLGKSTRL